jgi:hypothetical protein
MITMGTTRHQQVVAGVALLAQLDFTTGTQYLTTAAQTITTGGNTYTGLGSLVSVGNFNESVDSSAEKITIGLSVANAAMLSLALGSVEGYRGRAVRLYLQLYDEQFTPVASPVQRWSGVMDRVQITRKPTGPDSVGSGGGSVDMQCSRSGMARARNYQGLRLTHQQQQLRFAGDTGLQYVRTLIEQPTQWLSKRFQQQ